MPYRYLGCIGLTSLWFGASAYYFPAKAKPVVLSGECNPVGRVVKIANSQLPIGKVLCYQDKLRIPTNKQLKFVCFVSGQNLILSAGSRRVADYCDGVSYKFRRCTTQNPVHCPNIRNPNISVRATLFVPYSTTVMGGRPNFSWESDPQADQYSIEVFLGKISLWKQTASTNSLAYPEGVAPLQPSNAYLVTVTAYRGNATISSYNSVLNRISDQKAGLMQAAIGDIDALPIPETEKTLDKDRIYVSQGLVSESIGILKSQLEQDKLNPTLHRVLGDRFMNAGLPKEAQPLFQEAEFLASKEQDMFELAKAKAGLAEIAAIPGILSKPAMPNCQSTETTPKRMGACFPPR